MQGWWRWGWWRAERTQLHVQLFSHGCGSGAWMWWRNLLTHMFVYHLLYVLKLHPYPEYVSLHLPAHGLTYTKCTRDNEYINMLLTHSHWWKGSLTLGPVWVKDAGSPGPAHVALHLQSSVLFLLTDVLSFQLVLSLHNAPQHLTMDIFYVLYWHARENVNYNAPHTIVMSYISISSAFYKELQIGSQQYLPFAVLLCSLTWCSHLI